MTKPMVIGVVGLGAMGLGIAQVYAQAGFTVLATDAQLATLETAKSRLAEALADRVTAGKLTSEAREATLSNLSIVDNLRGLMPSSLIIEAIVEEIEAKRQVFSELEKIVTEDTIFASNTSSLSIAAMAEGLSSGSRLLGLHFFNPAPVMKLVELIAHADTNGGALLRAREVTEAAGKTVIACPDLPGFIVNRCARPFYGEALALLEEGRTATEIDAAMVSAGYRIGPFGLIDLVGADINLAATQGLAKAMRFHPRYHVFDTLVSQVGSGKLGRKSGSGFVFPHPPVAAPVDAEAIVLRIEATLANEAASLMVESGLDEVAIETALKLGLNFPRGPFESARQHGLPTIRETLAKLEERTPSHLTGRYRLSPALETLI